MAARRTRDKGIRFERDVAQAFEAAGFTVRGLEAGGDHFVVDRDGKPRHGECKRQERLRIPEWIEQVERDCPPGVPWFLAFKQSRRPVYVVTTLEDYLGRA